MPQPLSRGILPTWVNFTSSGKCVYMTSLPLGVYLPPRGKFAPRGKLMNINGALVSKILLDEW